jgi:cystathionine beta-lyase
MDILRQAKERQMKYDFDKVIDRLNTSSSKWDLAAEAFGEKDIIPLTAADMDFQIPMPVTEALLKRVEHGVYGYTCRLDPYYESVIDWMKKKHGWTVKKDWICHAPGVVGSLCYIIDAFSQPGDKVVIQPPVYHPFAREIRLNDRQVLNNPLKFENGHYTMDLDDLREKLDPSVKIMIISAPHNPVGRVWTKEELDALGEICKENNVLLVSDEVHCDLLFQGHTHVSLGKVSEELNDKFVDNMIICTAASKTFNLAGLQTSNIIIPNKAIREKYIATLDKFHSLATNTFGIIATENSYRYGDEWLAQLLVYLKANQDFVSEFLETRIPKMKLIEPEGTYLLWIDCKALGMDCDEMERFFAHDAKVGLNQGHIFGEEGKGFVRMNIAYPRSILKECLERIEKAVNEYSVSASRVKRCE